MVRHPGGRARALAAIALTACGLAGGSARAIELDAEIATGVTASTTLGRVWLVSPLISLGVPLSESWDLTLTLGFTVASATDPDPGLDGSRVELGAPHLAFAWRIGEGLVFAPGITVPLSTLPDPDDPAHVISAAAVNGGRGLRGRIDEWLWLPDELGFVFPLHWATWADPLIFELDLALAYVVPTSASDPDDDFLLQAVFRFALRLTPGLWLGGRFAATFIPTNTADNGQLSIAPEVRWMIPDTRGYIGARFQVNLDTPYGPSFEPGRIWGVHLASGWSF